MPRLEQYILPVHPVNVAMQLVLNQLQSAVDISPVAQPLNQSVLMGVDAVFADAINGKPPETQLPAIRIMYSTLNGDASNESFLVATWDVQVWLYFLYYVGQYSTQFQELREQHIRANLNYLKQNVFADNIGMEFYQWWKFNDQIVVEDHDTPLKYIDSSIIVKPPFSCSRVDLSMKVHNYIYTNQGGASTVPRITGDWIDQTTDTTLMVSKAYKADSTSRLNLALPSAAALGDSIIVAGYNTGGWKVTQNISQTIYIAGSTNTTTSGALGYLQSVDPYDWVQLTCIDSVGNKWMAQTYGCETA
ncbi:MAG: hypothetical protein KGH93_03315 [Patescibacteria group bacterium]|nr:hypothetical protein [Patescibacteria group bacterium]